MSGVVIGFSVGNENVNLDREQMKSFLTAVKDSGDLAVKSHSKMQSISVAVKNNFSLALDLSGTKQVMEDLKDKIRVLEDRELATLFQESLSIINFLAENKPPSIKSQTTEGFTYMGYGSDRSRELQFTETGTYAVFSLSDWTQKTSKLVVVSHNGNNQLTHYDLFPDQVGGYTFYKQLENGTKIEEKFNSFQEFIESKKESFKQPLIPKTSFDFEKLINDELEALPYFKQMDYVYAVNAIANTAPGTYLIRDKESNPEAKVIIYKDIGGEVKSYTLTPHPGSIKGYDCNGKWYAGISAFIELSKSLDNKFKLSLEEAEAERQIAAIGESLKEETKAPQFKTEVYDSYRDRLEQKNERIEGLIKEAFRDGHFEVVKWLVKKHGTLKPLEEVANLTDRQQGQLRWLKLYMEMPVPGPETLDHYAIHVGNGYKTSNLMVQKRNVQELNARLKTAEADVPDFLPFSDFEIQEHLRPIMPEIECLYNEFIETFSPEERAQISQKDFDLSVTSILIKPQAKVLLAKIENILTKYFLEHPFDTPELQEWLKNHPDDFLIIRSTGKEDTEQNSNPGGNETISYVRPNVMEINKAMIKLFSSYVGIKSVAQRLMVGDSSLFTEKLFFPVLIMNMVTEKVNGEPDSKNITRSGVMFTQQKGKAEGVTLLQVGLGNNEGIVSSKVAVDTHYIDEEGHIMSVVRQKKTRYVPQQSMENTPVHNEPMYNDKKIEWSQALPDSVILDMKITADFFAEKYAKEGNKSSMDLEYTIKPQGGKNGKPLISLLQIRPLVEKGETHPTYLDLAKLEKISMENKSPVRTLLSGDSSVQDITNLSDVMFVDNLTQGLIRYLKTSHEMNATEGTMAEIPGRKHRLPKVIFTKKTAPITSHESIFFRKQGVVVYVVEDQGPLEKIKIMIGKASPNHPVKSDPQRGILVETQGIQNSKEMEVDGYVSYPIPLEISLPQGLFTSTKGGIPSKELEVKLKLLNERYAKLDKLKGDKEYMKDKSPRNLLDIIATSNDRAEAQLALATLLKMLNSDLKSSMKASDSASRDLTIGLLQIFDAATQIAENQILPALAEKPSHPNRLFALKFLDALIFQPAQLGILDCQSWKTVKSTALTEAKMKEMAKKFGLPLENGKQPEWRLQMQKLSTVAINEKTRKAWTVFVNEIASGENPQSVEEATRIVIDVVKMNIGNEWISLVFFPIWNNIPEGANKAEKVLNELVAIQNQDTATLDWVKQQMDLLQVQRDRIGQWSNPEYTQKHLMELRNLYYQQFGFYNKEGKPDLVNRYEESNKIGRLALLGFYRQAVDAYDQSIKSVTESREYPTDDQQKALHVAQLLVGDHRMLKGALQLIPKEDEVKLMSHKWENTPLTFQEILDGLEHEFEAGGGKGLSIHLQKLHNKTAKPKELLEARPNFNVEPMIIGSHNDLSYGVTWPATLEEIFTTIHQNLDKVRKHLVTKEGLSSEILEGEAKVFSEIIENTFVSKHIRNSNYPDISHINLAGSKLEVCYQIPLLQHSCSVSFSFDINHPENGITVEASAYGKNEHDRWVQAAAYGTFLGNIGSVSIPNSQLPKINYSDPRGVSFSLHFPSGINPEQIMDKIWYILDTLSNDPVHSDELVNNMQSQIPSKNWNDVHESFFGTTPYLAIPLMNRFSETKASELLLKACLGTFESLINYGLDDYSYESEEKDSLKGYYNDPKYSYVPGNNTPPLTGSSKLCATLYLIQQLHDNRALAEPVVQKLIANPEMNQHFPQSIEALKTALKDLG